MAKIIDPKAILKKMIPGKEISPKVFMNMEESDIVKHLFGPDPQGPVKSEDLPIYLWIWGLDAS